MADDDTVPVKKHKIWPSVLVAREREYPGCSSDNVACLHRYKLSHLSKLLVTVFRLPTGVSQHLPNIRHPVLFYGEYMSSKWSALVIEH